MATADARMFVRMKHLHPFRCLPLLAIAACGSPPGPTNTADGTARDTLWVGEMRILDNDTVFSPCGTTRWYRMQGPALDTLARRYRHYRRIDGQWIKSWVNAHTTLRGTDTVLHVATFMHIDPAVPCEPTPDSLRAGSYVARYADPMGERVLRMDLFPDGDAVMHTSLQNGIVANEVEGTWGMDKDRFIATHWPQRHIHRRYRIKADTLVPYPAAGNGNNMVRDGAADRMRGSYGRTARWLAEAAGKAQGHRIDPSSLRPDMMLDSLFPTAEARALLRGSAADTLGFNEDRMAREWDALATVKDVVPLIRVIHLRNAQ